MISSLATLIIAVTTVQVGASVAKQLFPFMGVMTATFLRLSLTTLVLSVIWPPWQIRLSNKQKIDITLYGISLAFMNLLFYLALERIPLGISVALEFLGPLAVSIFYSRKLFDFIWVVFSALGVFCLLPVSSNEPLDPTGILLALGAGVCWAAYIIFGQRAASSLPHSGRVTALGMFVATIVIFPFYYFQKTSLSLSWQLLPQSFLMAMLSSAIPYTLEMSILKKIPKKTYGILMSLEPVTAALSGLIFLSEYLTVQQWLAIGFIITASTGSSLSATPLKPIYTRRKRNVSTHSRLRSTTWEKHDSRPELGVQGDSSV